MLKMHSNEYGAISDYYRGKTASSGVPYINHINEGLDVLWEIGASDAAQRGYCLHPLVQNDKDLQAFEIPFFGGRYDISWAGMMMAMEYRRVANSYLSDMECPRDFQLDLGPRIEVKHMLIADKVQNYKDFRTYHLYKHPRSKELDVYFINWMLILGIDGKQFIHLCNLIDALKLERNQ